MNIAIEAQHLSHIWHTLEHSYNGVYDATDYILQNRIEHEVVGWMEEYLYTMDGQDYVLSPKEEELFELMLPYQTIKLSESLN